MLKAGKAHEVLKKFAGTWDAEISEDGPTGPVKSKGSDVSKLVVGGMWLMTEFKGQVMGAEFEGCGLTGYDEANGKYVGSWVDTQTPMPMHLIGTYDEKTKTLTMMSSAPGPEGKPTQMRHKDTFVSDDHRSYSIEVEMGPDTFMKVLDIQYKRRK